jgi:hypothetical protein
VAHLERAIPTVVVLVRGEDDRDVPGAQATVDGVRREVAAGRAFELDPGTHVFRIDAPDRPSFSSTATIVEGERGRLLRLTLPPRCLPRPAPVAIVLPALRALPPPAAACPCRRRGRRLLRRSARRRSEYRAERARSFTRRGADVQDE